MKISLPQIYIPKRARTTETTGAEWDALVQSIQELGIINPITVYQQDWMHTDAQNSVHTFITYQLICGERRFKATKQLGWAEIDCRIIPQPDSRTKMMLELDENRQRKDFYWQELVVLKGKLYYTLLETDPKMTQKKFSEDILGQSEAWTTVELALFDARDTYPDVFLIESETKAYQELKQHKLTSLMAEQNKRIKNCSEGATTEKSVLVSPIQNLQKNRQPEKILTPIPKIFPEAVEMLKSLPAAFVDGCVTDPQFGIQIQKVKRRNDGVLIYREGNKDTPEQYFTLMDSIFQELSRVLKPGASLYFFFSMIHYQELTMLLSVHNFTYWPHPIIWIKSHPEHIDPGSCQAPDIYPAMSYYPIMMCHNAGKKRPLVKMGQPNVLFGKPVHPANKTHPLEIPCAIYWEFMNRSYRPGDIIVDPFCGTGNSLLAGFRTGYTMIGSEISPQYRTIAENKVLEEVKKMGGIYVDKKEGKEKEWIDPV